MCAYFSYIYENFKVFLSNLVIFCVNLSYMYAYLNYICDMELFNCKQTIWQLNIGKYLERRSKLYE